MQKVHQLLLALVALIGLALGQPETTSNNWEHGLYPIYAGGTKDERIGCFLLDEANGLVIVGGNTTSSDFAPAANDHGFLYALDLEGNWMWSKFIYNVSYAVSDITGCQLNSDGKSMTVLGMGNTVPVIMDINTSDGIINKYISLEYIETSSDVVPDYVMYGAIYNDKADFFDGKNYIYVAFLMDLKLEFLRLHNTNEPVVDWCYEFTDDDATVDTTGLYRNKDPQFLHIDPKDDQSIYMTGRYFGRGAVMKFQKRNAKLKWMAYFGQMLNVRAWSQIPDDDHFYICGDYHDGNDAETDLTTVDYTAAIARMKNDGSVRWYISASGNIPGSTSKQDRCMGVAHNPATGNVGVLLQAKMT